MNGAFDSPEMTRGAQKPPAGVQDGRKELDERNCRRRTGRKNAATDRRREAGPLRHGLEDAVKSQLSCFQVEKVVSCAARPDRTPSALRTLLRTPFFTVRVGRSSVGIKAPTKRPILHSIIWSHRDSCAFFLLFITFKKAS